MMNSFLLVQATLNMGLGIFLMGRSARNTHNIVFSMVCILASLWTLANYAANTSTNIIWLRSTYAFGGLVIAMSLVWVMIYVGEKNVHWRIPSILFFALLLFFASFFPDFITKKDLIDKGLFFVGKPGYGLFIFITFYSFCSISIITKIFTYWKHCSYETKKQSGLIFIGAIICLVTTLFSSFVLPFFSFFPRGGIDNIGFLIFILCVVYSIFQHNLFNLKLVTLEVTIFLFCILMATRTIILKRISEIEMILFLLVVIFGLLLLKCLRRISEQSSQIDMLAQRLQKDEIF